MRIGFPNESDEYRRARNELLAAERESELLFAEQEPGPGPAPRGSDLAALARARRDPEGRGDFSPQLSYGRDA
jgi:hypothetical protein